jgi:hypothetical protein
MQVIEQIGLEAAEILTLVFGILGTSFSSLLLFSPNMTRSISNVFNRPVSIDEKVAYLDTDVHLDSFFYSHNLLLGTCLVTGSSFSLIFLFFKMDTSNFANIFFSSHNYHSTNEMLFTALSWISTVASVFGLFFGALLFFAPHKMRKIEAKLNFWFETRPAFDKLEESTRELDTILFSHSVLFGLIGLILSIFIIILSILNLLS